MNYTHCNYLYYTGMGKLFQSHINYLYKTSKTYFQESIEAFRIMYEQKQGKVYLFYSGGIDSEYALAIFKTLKMDVTPVIIKYNDEINAHDTDYAFRFCKDHQITPIVINFDLIDFIESGKILDIPKKINCHAYQYTPTLQCMLNFDGTIFMAEGDPYLKYNEISESWDFIEYERISSLINFYTEYNVHGTPLMLNHTAGMLSAFMLDSTVKKLAANEIPGKLSSFSSRHLLYNDNDFFYLEPRQKYGGYEKFETMPIFKNHSVFREFELLTKQFSNYTAINYYDFVKQHNLE